MKWIIKIIVLALAVVVIDRLHLLPGIFINSFTTSVVLALVLALLNTFVKPVLTILTIPLTIVTLGLFLLVINVIIIYIADALIGGFRVDGFLSAFWFSIVLAVVNWLLSAVLDD